jgi:hypothetical protein
MLAKLIRRTAEQSGSTVTFTEMLPRTDQTWLPDADGNTYTSEFRVVAVDLKARSGERDFQTVKRGGDR